MAGKLQFTLEEYQDAARKYRKDLLMLPIIGIQDTLKFMTGRPGIRYKESVAAMSGNAQTLTTSSEQHSSKSFTTKTICAKSPTGSRVQSAILCSTTTIRKAASLTVSPISPKPKRRTSSHSLKTKSGWLVFVATTFKQNCNLCKKAQNAPFIFVF